MSKAQILLRLIRFTYNYKASILLLVILGFLSVGFSVLQPLPVKYIIDNVLSNHPLPENLRSLFLYFGEVPGDKQLLLILVIASVLMVIGTSVLSYISTAVTTKVCQRLVYDFSVALFDKMQKLSLSFFSKNNVGDLMARLSGDTYVIYSVVGGIMLPTILSVTSLVSMFYVMYTINSGLALLAISTVPLFAILLFVFNKPMTHTSTYQSVVSGHLWSFMQQSLSAVKVIQAYSRESFTREQFKKQSHQYNQASLANTRIGMVYNGLIGIVTGIATAIVIGIGGYKGLNGEITTGELFLFISYIGSLFGPVNSLASIIVSSFSITARAKRVFEILDSEEVVSEKSDAVELTSIEGHVELRNVSFGYGIKHDASAILNNFNLEVDAGKVVAIVGPTGAGKTSMISLLLRFYDPWEGDVFIDGKNLKDVTLSSLRRNITLVLQDAFIFPISVADNIAFGKPGAARDEIIAAAKAAQAHEFISRLPEGYDTVVSEGGLSLSGGEKQRLSLARAFLRDSPILILDEPTSAMDVQTEAKIFKALSTYSAGRTVFIISHRLSTVRHADMIISIKDGVIVEKGNHETLLQGGKVYAEFYKHQGVAG
ncbi:ABC transporter ATP-binding protein [Aridibaculum aurantiacum]|uniref:ABC transporter ATP-binding protein n=1 Tax=Aridibaculum aurantiacum TaxID=2810307 RepID=UPI001A9756CC|nr:ABC transporter ATP-binding protein [Aridibaculum aurantiacum]